MNSTIAMDGEDIVITMLDANVSNINLSHEAVMAIVDLYNPGMFVDGKLVITNNN